MRKKLLVMALMVAIVISYVAYDLAAADVDSGAKNNPEASTNVIEFNVVVNGIRSVVVPVHVKINDGLTEQEAELIARTTFIQVMGEHVTHQLDTLTFDDGQINAHYAWGYDEDDMGHVFDMSADLTMLQITVWHCF